MTPAKGAVLASAALLALGVLVRADEGTAHYWPHNRGRIEAYSRSPYVGPFRLNESLAWRWPPNFGEQYANNMILGGPLIDSKKNIYISMDDNVKKFSPDGRILWEYRPRHGSMPNCPVLMGNALFQDTTAGHHFALDIETGAELWDVQTAPGIGGDTGYLEAHDGVVVGGTNPWQLVYYDGGGGDVAVVGLNATDGSKLWEFIPDSVTWNIMGVFPGDDTVLFQDKTGVVYRLGLHNGTLIWKSGMAHDPQVWTDGGLLYGNNGIVYSVYTGASIHKMQLGPEVACPGRLNALRLSDGRLLWYQTLPFAANSWPAVGPLRPGAAPSVVTLAGTQGGVPAVMKLPSWTPFVFKGLLGKFSSYLTGGSISHSGAGGYYALWHTLYKLGLWLPYEAQPGVGVLPRVHIMYAFDAQTGQMQWQFRLPPWYRLANAGEEEGLYPRLMNNKRILGLPNPCTDPTIGGDGVVYFGDHDGRFYAIRDKNGDGEISGDEEVNSMEMYDSFQNPGPGLAPGMLAVVNQAFLWVFKW